MSGGCSASLPGLLAQIIYLPLRFARYIFAFATRPQVHHLHQHRDPGQLAPGVAHCAGAAVPRVRHGAGRRRGAWLRRDPCMEQPLQANHCGFRFGYVDDLAYMHLQRASLRQWHCPSVKVARSRVSPQGRTPCAVLERSLWRVMTAWASMYFFTRFGFQSGGILAALTLGLVVKELWRRSCPRCLASQV
jgi:hypothetical protein